MRGGTRKTTAAGAAAFVLAGSAALAASPGTASADPITTASCGQTVTAKAGDQISTPFGVRTATDGVTSLVGGLLDSLCTVTVNVVDTTVAPVVGQSVVGTVTNSVSAAKNTVTGAVAGAGSALSGTRAPAPSSGGASAAPNGGIAADGPQSAGNGAPALAPSGPTAGDLTLVPFGASLYAPMRDYGGIPYALTALWAPSPGIGYGYAPEPGTTDGGQGSTAAQNAGRAEALPGTSSPGMVPVGLPALVAALALSAAAAALVRTWVVRGTR